MLIGNVNTFENVKISKEQALKILEEAAEVFGAYQNYCNDQSPSTRVMIIEECADVIQATCNLLAAFGINDMTMEMLYCKERNKERGRAYEKTSYDLT